jgi:hypothetical protein
MRFKVAKNQSYLDEFIKERESTPKTPKEKDKDVMRERM